MLRWSDAALAGLASSMRTTAGPVLLAARGRLSGPLRIATFAASVGELIVDKTPIAGDRTDPPALIGRVAAGAYTGSAVAGPVGVAAGGFGALVGTFASFHLRKSVVERTGLPDRVVALVEDAVALTLAAFATRPTDPAGPGAVSQ